MVPISDFMRLAGMEMSTKCSLKTKQNIGIIIFVPRLLLKVLEKQLDFLLRKGYKPCIPEHASPVTGDLH